MASESVATGRPKKPVMIDIETLSTANDALVLSIGAVQFDCIGKDGPWFGDDFLAVPSLTEQLLLGRRVDQNTQRWWNKQPKETQEHWLNPVRTRAMSVTQALLSLSDFLEEATQVWANGSHFDLCILESLYRSAGREAPWKYNSVRDARTLYAILPHIREYVAPSQIDLPHHPLADCRAQIIRMWEHGYDR